MAAKLSLIDTELLLKLLDKRLNSAPPALPMPPPHPILREMSAIDDKMQGALADPGLSDLSKSQKINSLLSKHDNFTRQFENQPPPTVSLEPPPLPERAYAQDRWYAKTVDAMPPSLRQKAAHLLDHIKSTENIQWDRDGRIVIDNVALAGTNVLDLVHGATRQRKNQPTPSGARQFLEALDKSNTPKELVPNAAALRKDRPEGAQSMSMSMSTPSPGPKQKRKRTKSSPSADFMGRWVSSSSPSSRR